MTKESRLVFLAGLTLALYAGVIFLQQGQIVFPFPINSFIFLVIAFQYTIWHHKKGLPVYIFLISALFGVLANPVFWEILMPIEDLGNFLKQPWTIWFKLINAVGIVISAVILINRQKRHYTSMITTLGVISYGAGFHLGSEHFSFAGFGLIALSVIIRPTYKPLHLIWILLFVLEFTKWFCLSVYQVS